MGQGINSADKATSGTSKTTLLRTIDTRGVSRDVLVTLVPRLVAWAVEGLRMGAL